MTGCVRGRMAPLVTIVIPCLNEERNIVRCLDSIGRQTYPHDRIEVLVADGFSKDRTRDLIAAWNTAHDVRVTIVDNPRVIAEFGNAAALRVARGDFLYLMGCDEEMAQADWIERFVEAFTVFPGIVGVEQHWLPEPGGLLVNNYLAAIHINDPLARDIAAKPRQVAVREVGGRVFREFTFTSGYPAKLFLKRDAVEPFIGEETFEEGQVMMRLAAEGRNRMAMVDGYGNYHRPVKSLRQYLRRCRKIALKHTTRSSERDTWVKHTGNRIIPFALLNMTFIYPVALSFVKAVSERQPFWLLHGPVAFVSVWGYALNWLRIKLLREKAW